MGVSGLILCVLLLSAGSVLVGLVLFAVFIALGGFLTYLRSDDAHAMQKDANGFSRSRQLVEVKMEERIRKAVESYKNCLESLEYAPQVISVSSLDYFLDSVFPNFNDMNAAGVVPRNPLVTYAIAWTVLLDEYQKINHPVSSRIRDLHDEWVRLVAKSAKLSLAVAAETDSVKRRGRRSAMSGAIDAVVGGTKTARLHRLAQKYERCQRCHQRHQRDDE